MQLAAYRTKDVNPLEVDDPENTPTTWAQIDGASPSLELKNNRGHHDAWLLSQQRDIWIGCLRKRPCDS
jgi:hypothetical protein